MKEEMREYRECIVDVIREVEIGVCSELRLGWGRLCLERLGSFWRVGRWN